MAALALSILFLLLGLLSAITGTSARLTRIGAAVTAAIILVLTSAFLVSHYFTGDGISETVAFHLESGLLGAGISEHIGPGILAFLSFALASVLLTLLFRVAPKLKIRYRRTVLRTAAIALLGASFAVHPAVHDVWRLAPLYWPIETTGEASRIIAPPDYMTPAIGDHRELNLVYLYLEGLEQTYFDNRRFPGLLPNLSEIREEAVIYSDIGHTIGSLWTIAGMVTSQCGIPLLASSGRNAMEGVDQFLPEAVCIGDVLETAGYTLTYMGGAALSFAGKGNFYRSHGFHDVQGRTELQNHVSEDYLSSWGLYDDSLFMALEHKFDALASSDQPFGLFGLTLDTHHPTGHPSARCDQNPYKDGDSSMLNAVHCTDLLAAEFINHIRQSEHGDETVIVVASDHLALRSDVTPRLNEAERRNLLMILPPSGEVQEIDAPGTTLDVAATVLDWLGFEIDGLGFGRNLNSEHPSLRATKENLDAFLLAQRGFLNALWQYPRLAQGITLAADGPDGLLALGDRRITAPVVFKLGDDAGVEDIILSTERDRNLTDTMRNLADDERFLWVDRCAYIRDFIGNMNGDVAIRDRWCAVAGSLSGSELAYATLAEDNALGFTDISSALGHQPSARSLAATRRENLRMIAEMGGELQIVTMDIEDMPDVRIKSAGFGFGPSFVQTENAQYTLERGLTLIGLSPDGEISMHNEDTCGQPKDHNHDQLIADFQAGLREFSANQTTPVALVAHDSAVCGTEALVSRLRSQWGGDPEGVIGFREPYVGIIRDGAVAEEFNAAPGMTIAVELDGAADKHNSHHGHYAQ